MNIMISYRRADSGSITGRIYDRLQAHFGADHVFIDIDSIPMGIDYRHHIDTTIKRCDILLPVIGPLWTGPGEVGKRRIDDPSDLVRLEVAHALQSDVRVIPLLIGKAQMPPGDELPDDLKALSFRNALKVDSGVDFHYHMDRLCAAIEGAAQDVAGAAAAKNHRAPPPRTASGMPAQKASGRAAGLSAAISQRDERFQDRTRPALSHARPVFRRLTKSKWFFACVLAITAITLACIALLRFIPRSPSQAVTKADIAKKMTRVPDPRHFAAGSVGAQLVGTWKQSDASFLLFEDGTFSTNDPAKGGDEGHWELNGRHVIAKGVPSHPTRTWMLTLSRDGKILTGRLLDDWGNSEPVTMRRQ